MLEKGEMLSIIDSVTFFYQALAYLNQALRYDVSGFDPGLVILLHASSIFSSAGLSRSISRRVLDKMARAIGPDRPFVWAPYLAARSGLSYYACDWKDRTLCSDPLLAKQAEWGNAFNVVNVLYLSGCACLECGDWETFFEAQRVLETVSDRLDNGFGRACVSFLIDHYNIKRRLSVGAADAGLGFQAFLASTSASFVGTIFYWAHASTSRAELLRGNYESAVAHLALIPRSVLGSKGVLQQNGVFRRAGAALAVEKARRAVERGDLGRLARNECLDAIRGNLSNARKFAPDLTEALKFEGSFWWHTGEHRRALHYWNLSIREGEHLCAKVELAHTLVDAARLLGDMEPGPEWRQRGAELYAELGIGGFQIRH
jgi:hypothetical protein